MSNRHSGVAFRQILILGALSAFGPMSIDMYLPAFPAIAKAFETTPGMIAYTLAAFFIGLAFGQLVYGPLGDRFGRKGPILVGLALYVFASVACAFAPSVEALIGLRALQAFGACGSLVMSRAMVRDLFDVQDSAKVFSLLMLVMGVAPIVAPLLGGLMLGWAGWNGIFWALGAFGLVVALAVAFGLPETLPPERRMRVEASEVGRIYGRLLTHRRYMGYALAGYAAQAGMFAYIAGSPFVFITLHGVPEAHYGLYFGANAIGLIAVSQVNSYLLSRHAAPIILNRALVWVVAMGVLLALTAATGWGGFLGLVLPLFGYVAALGLVVPNATAAALGTQTTALGQASALIGAVQFGVAFLSGSIVGSMQDGTARPMGFTILACSILAFVFVAMTRTTGDDGRHAGTPQLAANS